MHICQLQEPVPWQAYQTAIQSFNIIDQMCPPSLPEIYIQICPTLTSVLLHPTLSVIPKHPEVNFSPHKKERAAFRKHISSDISICYLRQPRAPSWIYALNVGTLNNINHGNAGLHKSRVSDRPDYIWHGGTQQF